MVAQRQQSIRVRTSEKHVLLHDLRGVLRVVHDRRGRGVHPARGTGRGKISQKSQIGQNGIRREKSRFGP